MSKKWLLLSLVFVLAIPMRSVSQSYEDYYNAGYIIGATIRQAVDNNRAKKAEQERIERERLEADRAYELEQQRIANERYAIQQKEAEARRAEEERLRIANEAKRAEDERLRIAQEAAKLEVERLRLTSYGSSSFEEKDVDENNNVQLLTKNHLVKYFINENTPLVLGIEQGTEINEGCKLFFNNLYNDREIKFSCNKVSVKVKYFGDNEEQTFTDACSFFMPANTFGYLEWSDVFFNISEIRQIENIKVQFVNAQIK